MSLVVHSRAYLLIEQELLKFEKSPLKGIRLYPTKAGNYFSLSAKIKGLRDTLWDGAILKLRLKFSESFSYVPPEANFVTVPFHPNVEPDTGRVACPYLDDPQKWNSSVSLSDILSSIQTQLSTPDMRLVLNLEAADMLRRDFEKYRTVVAQCVQMSQIVENSPDQLRPSSPGEGKPPGQAPAEIEYDPQFLSRPKTRPAPKQHGISFEAYHADWSRLATSKPADGEPFNPATVWHNSDTLSAKMESHRRLKYGNTGQKLKDTRDANLERVDQMRRLYLAQRHAFNVSTSRSAVDGSPAKMAASSQQHQQLHQHQQQQKQKQHINTSLGHYSEEEEAEDLVRWTQDLPAEENFAATVD